MILVGVQGPVDPATVSAFVVREQNGPVVVMDLTAAAAGDLEAGFPRVAASYVASGGGAIAIQAGAPFPKQRPLPSASAHPAISFGKLRFQRASPRR